jgi:hypothetical protein
MRNLTAVALAMGLIASNAFAADAVAPLAPAKPAGLKQAQFMGDNGFIYIVGLGVVAAGIAIAASGGSSNKGATSGTVAATATS